MKSILAAAVVTLLSSVYAQDTVTVSTQTWFGWPDNCEDGYTQGCGNNDVAYDCVGRNYKASGDGSYDNPLTYATKQGGNLHNPCEVTWFPYLEKYLVMSDICTGCDDNQIDIWIGNDDGGQDETDCEINSPSGSGHQLIRNGPSTNTPNTNALWSSSNGCQVSNNVYPDNN